LGQLRATVSACIRIRHYAAISADCETKKQVLEVISFYHLHLQLLSPSITILVEPTAHVIKQILFS